MSTRSNKERVTTTQQTDPGDLQGSDLPAGRALDPEALRKEHLRTCKLKWWRNGHRPVNDTMRREIGGREEPFVKYTHNELTYLLALVRNRRFDLDTTIKAVFGWLNKHPETAPIAKRWAEIIGRTPYDQKAKLFTGAVYAAADRHLPQPRLFADVAVLEPAKPSGIGLPKLTLPSPDKLVQRKLFED